MRNTSWFYKYQPKVIEDYVFETEEQKTTILGWINNGFIPGNVIFEGPPGTGKTALSELIIQSIIKSQQDLNIISDLSVKNIDTLTSWLEKRPVKSKQKIIYLEEFDRLSSAAANSLKNRKMEKYQEYCSFICTTNHLNRIERALQTRFTYKFNLSNPNPEGTYHRIRSILTQENVECDNNLLYQFILKNIKIGIRDIINTIQVNIINNSIDFNNVDIQRAEHEEDIINNTLSIIHSLMTGMDINDKNVCLINPTNSKIASQYTSILNLIQYNNNINYANIFIRISENLNFLPIQKIVNEYLSSLEHKKLPHIHYISFIYDCMKSITDITI